MAAYRHTIALQFAPQCLPTLGTPEKVGHAAIAPPPPPAVTWLPRSRPEGGLRSVLWSGLS